MHSIPKKSQVELTMFSHIRLKFPTLAVCTVSLPLVSFIFCVVWSLLFDFQRSTSTHCGVDNYLPSISAAIGSFVPQKYVWQTFVGVHSLPRYLVVAMYYSHLCDILFKDSTWQWLACVIFLLQVSEVSSLLGLTFVTSSENFQVHEVCFVTFIVTSISGMLLLWTVMRNGTKRRLTSLQKMSLQYKIFFAVANLSCTLLAVYFYLRHNWHCESMMYTYFAFFEYIVVVTNMCYHMTAYWDFCDHHITLNSCCSLSITPQHPKLSINDFVVKVA